MCTRLASHKCLGDSGENYAANPAMNNDPQSENKTTQQPLKPLRFKEAVGQAFALIFAVQNKTGRRRLMELAETNPMPVIFAGVVSMVIFFSFCLITSQFFIHLLTK